jgi:hypothetical protein
VLAGGGGVRRRRRRRIIRIQRYYRATLRGYPSTKIVPPKTNF